jgi:hypothetical protein
LTTFLVALLTLVSFQSWAMDMKIEGEFVVLSGPFDGHTRALRVVVLPTSTRP